MENIFTQAKEKIAQAQEELIEKYSAQIKEVYKRSDIKKKALLLEGIEVLLEATEMEESIRIGRGFDNIRAQKLRERTGLKQAGLAKQLGISPTYICKYESGAANPVFRTAKEPAKKYLAWLKEQGYEV